MGSKKISEMTEKEILRRQLELLAEYSATCNDETVLRLTEAMCLIYKIIGDDEAKIVSYHIRDQNKKITQSNEMMKKQVAMHWLA